MEQFTEALNFAVSLTTIAGQAFLFFVLVIWVASSGNDSRTSKKYFRNILNSIASKAVSLSFVVALIATIGSLIYSDIIGYEPCKLCWVQRIFLYPQVIILGLALWRKTRDSELYCLALSVIGGIIALYHFYGQSINPSALPACDIAGGVSCAVRFFVEFGYITIPMMSFTTFAILTVCLLLKISLKPNALK